ncbi:MAG: M28 family peptidase [Burkholderiales bacterium]
MNRRVFLEVSGRTVMLALAANTAKVTPVFAAHPASTTLEDRVASVVQIYDSQGNHRTASDGDTASAYWLSEEVRRLNVEPVRESFSLNRVDPQSCYVQAGGWRIDGVPLFDAGFTGVQGVGGRLGPLGSYADIGLAESEPSRLTDPGSESRRAFLAEIRQSRHKAVVLLTRGSRPGLFLLNAPAFRKPNGPPTLQVSSAESQRLTEVAQTRAEATLVAHVDRTAAQAFNVTARIAGTDPSLPPFVVSTPRSGWWQCASERGGGLACWLEAMRSLAASKPTRDCLFVAFSGHEIGWLGIDDYLKRRPELVKRAHAWIHLGANIGAPRQPNMINASDDALERWATLAMEAEGLTVNRKAGRGTTPFGEAAVVHRGGGRYLSMVCDSDVFHHASDRWPEAVDTAVLARYARAFANGAMKLAI